MVGELHDLRQIFQNRTVHRVSPFASTAFHQRRDQGHLRGSGSWFFAWFRSPDPGRHQCRTRPSAACSRPRLPLRVRAEFRAGFQVRNMCDRSRHKKASRRRIPFARPALAWLRIHVTRSTVLLMKLVTSHPWRRRSLVFAFRWFANPRHHVQRVKPDAGHSDRAGFTVQRQFKCPFSTGINALVLCGFGADF